MANPQIDSDDDVPEEVTLNEGREEAKQSQRNEKENSKRLADELKEKRKARAERKRKKEVADADHAGSDQNPKETEVSTEREKFRIRKRKGRQIDALNSGEELQGKAIGSVMLDESVVQLIRAREKRVGKGVGKSEHKYIEEPELLQAEVKKPSKSKHDDVPTNSRIQIVSLKAKPNSEAINSALKFRSQHFFGPQVKRSTAMLPTSRPYLASV